MSEELDSANSSTILPRRLSDKAASITSYSRHSSSSINSSTNSRYTNSGLTATSTFSSIINEQEQVSSNSSVIGILNEAVADEDDYGIVDTLDYEDVDAGIIGKDNNIISFIFVLLTRINTIKDHEYMFRSREAIIEQLQETEQSYLDSLELVMKYFLLPLRKDTKQSSFNFLGMKKMICTEREFRWLFGNFEEVINTHRLILKSLQER